MNHGTQLTEHDDRWLLPYGGERVIQVRVSYQLTLLLESGATVDIESVALMTHESPAAGTAPMMIVPERQDVAPALALFGATIVSAVAFKSGALRLVFDSGDYVDVQPHPEFEAWSVTGPGAICVVCRPGGGLAIWD